MDMPAQVQYLTKKKLLHLIFASYHTSLLSILFLPSMNLLYTFFLLVYFYFPYLFCVHRLYASCPIDSVSRRRAFCFPDSLTQYFCTQEVLWSLELAFEVFHDFFAYDFGGERSQPSGIQAWIGKGKISKRTRSRL